MSTDTGIRQQQAARLFAARWQGKGYEKGESQIFWVELLTQVFGVLSPSEYLSFEQQVRLDHTSFIDAYIPRTHVMIEQKSIEKDLGAPVRQSDGSLLNPFQQAKRYAAELPYSQRPRWIVTCNFREFRVYDMEQPNAEPQVILLENLEKEWYRLQFLVDVGNDHLRRETEVSVKAGELVGMIYDRLLEQYWSAGGPPADDMHASRVRSDILRSLNILCVRLVFCLYAEDTGLFPSRTSFHDYLAPYRPQDIRRALIDLFEVLDTPISDRDPYLSPDLAAFPYVNGGLFGNTLGARSSSPASEKTASSSASIIIPNFTDDLKTLLLEKASADFDWSEISPTIFGAVFESTLNPETRRSGGMHYTSIENIHKVIDPLFLDGLRAEFADILGARSSSPAQQPLRSLMRAGTTAFQRERLATFQDKLASLTFFDPACGSGNFLTETYLSLRRLENKVIQAMYGGANILTFDTLIKVNISQFHGIEINDFACTVAKTALWIAENQMMQQTSAIAGRPMDFLPLKTNANIVEGNALRMDWEELFRSASVPLAENAATETVTLPAYRYPDYIIGNPPFVGYAYQSKEQKADLAAVMPGFGSNIDYVAAWYKKSAELMLAGAQAARLHKIKAALVSTNSITQGEQVAAIWRPLLERYGVQIDFAWRTFRWDSEADIKAHVHCVIIGFSLGVQAARLQNTAFEPDALSDNAREPRALRHIFLNDNQVIEAKNINGYLLDAPDVFIENRKKPLCAVPEMIKGSQPTDGGNLILSAEEKEELVNNYPHIAPYIHRYIGSEEFINNKYRYCLWLAGVSPAVLRTCPPVMERIERVRQMRQASPKAATQKWAEYPTLFTENRQPDSDYLLVPRVSSERRRYVPVGYMLKEDLCSDANFVVPNASLYHFGIITSNVHNAWMRAVCGRLKSDYRYSNTIVYNNFPWPNRSVSVPLATKDNSATASNPPSIAPELNSGISSEHKAKIEQTAQAILDARALYPDCSLADLYDENTMPPELRRAHQDNDRAVMDAYGFSPRMTESECVAELFRLYQQLTAK